MISHQIFVTFALLLVASTPFSSAQRPPYAGQRPVTDVGVVPLDNRFGGNAAAPAGASPAVLPVAALGDAGLINQLNQRPADHRPFWLVNAEAIEAQKNGARPAAAAATATAGGRPAVAASAVQPTATLPVLTNRFAADDDVKLVSVAPVAAAAPTSSFSTSSSSSSSSSPVVHGSANDAGNFLISRPEIVYPLPSVASGPVSVSASSPTVIMLNGQPFLLTPLAANAGARSGAAIIEQQLQQQKRKEQQQEFDWLNQREQPLVYFD